MKITVAKDWRKGLRYLHGVKCKHNVPDFMYLKRIHDRLSSFFSFLHSLPESDKNNAVSEKDRILQEKEAEIRHMQELLAVMQAQMQQQQP